MTHTKFGFVGYHVDRDNFRSVKALFANYGYKNIDTSVLEMLGTDFNESEVFSFNMRARVFAGLTYADIDKQSQELAEGLKLLKSLPKDHTAVERLQIKLDIANRVLLDLRRISYLVEHYAMVPESTESNFVVFEDSDVFTQTHADILLEEMNKE